MPSDFGEAEAENTGRSFPESLTEVLPKHLAGNVQKKKFFISSHWTSISESV